MVIAGGDDMRGEVVPRLTVCLVALSTWCSTAVAADLTVGMPDWPSAQAGANIIKYAVEKQFGLKVDVRELGELTIFAGLALLLAAIGIYGLMSYTVEQRMQEIGIRLALGAETRDMLAMIVRQGMLLAGIGLTIGKVANL